MFICQWGWVEAGHPAAICCYPIGSTPCFQQIVDEGMGQALFYAISGELIAVEAAQTITSAEPQKTARVPNDTQDNVARQTVGSRVGAYRKLLGKEAALIEKKRKHQAPHGDEGHLDGHLR